MVYRGVNPLTIELSDHGAPSLFLFTSNYGAGTPLPFSPSLSSPDSSPGSRPQPFPAGKAPLGREFRPPGIPEGWKKGKNPKTARHPRQRRARERPGAPRPGPAASPSAPGRNELIQLKAVTPAKGRRWAGAARTKGFWSSEGAGSPGPGCPPCPPVPVSPGPRVPAPAAPGLNPSEPRLGCDSVSALGPFL